MEGDHTIFVGRVERRASAAGEPLLYFRGQVRATGDASRRSVTRDRDSAVAPPGRRRDQAGRARRHRLPPVHPRSRSAASFEAELARYVGVRHAVLTNSATAGLWLTLRALGVKAGDEILVPSHTAFPTIEAICFAEATPVFVDADAYYTHRSRRRRREGDAAHRRADAGAPLRPAGGPRRRPRAGLAAGRVDAGGLRAGARRRLARPAGRRLRPRGRVLVLPVEEPHGHGRRRRRRHRRRRDRRALPAAARPRPAQQGRARRGRLQPALQRASRPRSAACCCAGSTR